MLSRPSRAHNPIRHDLRGRLLFRHLLGFGAHMPHARRAFCLQHALGAHGCPDPVSSYRSRPP
eukprot:6904564-Alexandrium_andersonii.AAC.1